MPGTLLPEPRICNEAHRGEPKWPSQRKSQSQSGSSGTLRATMRLLLYNIRYGLGLGSALHWPLPGMGYLLGNRGNLQRITDFIKSQDPDIVGSRGSRHRLDQNAQSQSGRSDRAFVRPLLRLSVQVRGRFVESAAADPAEPRQRVSRGPARAWRTVPLLREGHQAAHHRARARGLLGFSRPSVAEVPASAHATAASARSRHGLTETGASSPATSTRSGASTRSIYS